MEQSILMADEAKAARAKARQFLAVCRSEEVCNTLQNALVQVEVGMKELLRHSSAFSLYALMDFSSFMETTLT